MLEYMRYTIYIMQSRACDVYTKPSFNILFRKVLDNISSSP